MKSVSPFRLILFRLRHRAAFIAAAARAGMVGLLGFSALGAGGEGWCGRFLMGSPFVPF